ncbi:AraC family transcriptional regulator [Paenibacillus sp. PAMC21692]|uniref:AraC family transcriptional regulator n=1 Tax=Paenibacillus sp. PAMC21692 TaxID=2762320 RepID=UPI00164D7CF5|nr:helix-turn-helix domain-containing protein [Paenibacillus sp. PAMC21692]QNK58197.1 helix-turn-helix domain-containing protein [Paenibacillus sp. PAMC21692]
MKISAKRTKLYYSFVLSHIVILLIPVFVMSAINYYHTKTLREEIDTSNYFNLRQAKDMMDLQLEELNNIAARISMDPKLKKFFLTQDAYSIAEGVTELRKHKTNSVIVEELYLYFKGEDKLYSSQGVSSFRTVAGRNYGLNPEEAAQLKAQMEGDFAPLTMTIGKVEGMNGNQWVAVLYPVPPQNDSAYGNVLFLIKSSVLTRQLENILGSSEGYVYITDDKDQVLASQNSGGFRILESDQLRQAEPGRHMYEIEYEGNSYSIIRVVSERMGWAYTLVLPTKQYLVRVSEFRFLMVVALIVIVLTGLAIALYLGLRNYRPIRELSEYAKIFAGKGSWGKGQSNEIGHIKETIDAVVQNNRQLEQQMHEQRNMLQEQVVYSLLTGRYHDTQQTNEPIWEQMLAGDRYCVFYLTVSETDRAKKGQAIELLAEVDLTGGLKGYGIALTHDHAIGIIVCAQSRVAATTNTQKTAAACILQLLHQSLSLEASISIGQWCHDTAQINRSFVEAAVASEYRIIAGTGSIIFYENTVKIQSKKYGYPLKELDIYIQSLKQGNDKIALETLRSIFLYMQQNTVSITMLRSLCFDIINSFYKAALEAEVETDVSSLLEFSDIRQLETELLLRTQEVCEAIRVRMDTWEDRLVQTALQYMKEQYHSPDMSLEQAAEHVHLSASYFGRLFKEHAGDTFTEVLGKLRLDAIKKELVQTNKSINAIIEDAGYLNASSFIRKFKQLEGITPGEYRKRNAFKPETLQSD